MRGSFGSGDFVARLLAVAAHGEKETLRLSRKVVDSATLERQIRRGRGVASGEVGSGGHRSGVVRARGLFCQLAVKGLG